MLRRSKLRSQYSLLWVSFVQALRQLAMSRSRTDFLVSSVSEELAAESLRDEITWSSYASLD